MDKEIPLVTFFGLEEDADSKFVQMYVKKGDLVLPYMMFDGRDGVYHSDILEKMLRMHHINNFATKRCDRRKLIPEIGGVDKAYHAVGMGTAIKHEGAVYIFGTQSYDYEIGPDAEHFGLILPNSKINLFWSF